MKNPIYLLPIVLLFFLSSCEKEDGLTGTLKISFDVEAGDYENVGISIYTYEDLDSYALIHASPDKNGSYQVDLLYGNYLIRAYYKGSSPARTEQIIPGETISIEFKF